MKIFETAKIKEIDEFTIRNEPVSSTDLMERAALGCISWLSEHLPKETGIYVFCGPGNNGGDGWAIARLLADQGYINIRLFQLHTGTKISADSEINQERLVRQGKVPVVGIRSETDFPVIDLPVVIVDALFGSGLSRPLEGISLELVKHLNSLGNKVISIDIPSGLMGEDNTANHATGIIRASVTLTLQFPKIAFFFAENRKFTGKWFIIPIGLHDGIIREKFGSYYYTILEDLYGKLKKREVFSHKGTYGHALLISGSYGMMGAAILSAKACIRSGVGLLTSHIPRLGYPIIQTSVPEAIFSIDKSDSHIANYPTLEKYTAIAAGPGLGLNAETVTALELLIKSYKGPLVLDADALNILAQHPEWLGLLAENTILTPHPGEFDRLAGKSTNGYERNQKQIELSKKYKIIIVLKGAYTSVSLSDGTCYFNSTGNPGMATAGCGDVLTGIVLSLLAQGYDAAEAAIIGVFIHGLAGDLSVSETGQRALIASDVINNIGNAFNKLENYENSVWS